MASAAWAPCAGATLHVPSGPRGLHLYVILNDAARLAGRGQHLHLLSVGISTLKADIPCDRTCVLRASCHPFVTADSFVSYWAARIDSVADLERFIRQGYFKPHETPMPANVLQRIRAGLHASPQTAQEYKTCGLVPL